MDQELVEALNLARKLHLGVLKGPPFFSKRRICHGLENTCDCEKCKETRALMEERGFRRNGQIALPRAPRPPAQPWDLYRKAA